MTIAILCTDEKACLCFPDHTEMLLLLCTRLHCFCFVVSIMGVFKSYSSPYEFECAQLLSGANFMVFIFLSLMKRLAVKFGFPHELLHK